MRVEAGLQRITFSNDGVDGGVDVDYSCRGDVFAREDVGAVAQHDMPAADQVDDGVGVVRFKGSVNLTERNWESTAFGHTWADPVGGTPGSGGYGYASHVVPGGESAGHFGAVIARGELVSAWPEVRRNRAEHRQEPLCRTG